MKINWRNFFTIFFLVIGLAAMYVIVKGYGLRAIINVYKNFNPTTLLLYIIAVTCIFIVLTWRWDVILRSREIKVPFLRLFYYRIIGTAINFFTPGPRVGGEPTQAALLGEHGAEFTKALSTVMIDKIIDTTTSGLLFIIGAILVMLHYVVPIGLKIFLIVGAILFVTIVGIFYYRMLTNRHFFLRLFQISGLNRIKNQTIIKLEHKIEEIELIMIDFYKNDKKAFMVSMAISIFSWAVMFAEYKLATTLLGLHLGYVELFFIISFIGMAVLFPIPMAVGVLEAGQVSAFAIIGISGSAAVALAFLVRIKDLAWGVIGMILLAIFGFSPAKIVEKKYQEKRTIIERKKRTGS